MKKPNPPFTTYDALRELIGRFDAEIHNAYDGTSYLDGRLAEIDHLRAASVPKPLLSRHELTVLVRMIIALEEWRGALVGNPDPAPLAEFDRNLADAKTLVKKLRAQTL